MMSAKFYHDRPWLPWQRNLSQNWLLLRLYERYLRDPCVYQVFWVGLLNDVSQILPRPSVVAMATKFELKLAISRLMLSPRSWRLSVCNKCARSILDWSQSKIFLVIKCVLCFCCRCSRCHFRFHPCSNEYRLLSGTVNLSYMHYTDVE